MQNRAGLFVTVLDPSFSLRLGTPEPMRHVRGEDGVEQTANQHGRRVVGAGGATGVRCHDSLEHAAQHVGGDTAISGAFGDREVESLEQAVERVAPERVGQVALEVALDGVRLEETAVEEGDRAERGGAAAPLL